MNRRDFIAAIATSPAPVATAMAEQRLGTAAPAPQPRPLTITLLGTGTPAPSIERQSSGYLIEVGQSTGLLQGKLAAKRPEDLPG